MQDFSCREQLRELEWEKVSKGVGVMARQGFLPCVALKCL